MLSIGYDSAKHVLCYQTESLKDEFNELEEKFKTLHSEYKEKSRLLDFMQRDFNKIKQEKILLQTSLSQKQQLLKDSNLTCQEINHINQYHSSSPADNPIDIKDFNHSSMTKTNDFKLNNVKYSVISLLETLPGKNLNEKILLIQESKEKIQNELNTLKNELELHRNKGNVIKQKLEDKLQIKLDHSENTLKQIRQAEVNTKMGDPKLFELRFQLRQTNALHQVLKSKWQRMERQMEIYKGNELDSDRLLDQLRIDKKKLQRELRDARNRIEELQADSVRSQKLIEKLKENRLVEMKKQRDLNKSDEEHGDVSGDEYTDNSMDYQSHSY